MKYKMFDRVLLKTGETAYIVEIYGDDEYEVELVPSKEEFPLRTVKADDIEKFIGLAELKKQKPAELVDV